MASDAHSGFTVKWEGCCEVAAVNIDPLVVFSELIRRTRFLDS